MVTNLTHVVITLLRIVLCFGCCFLLQKQILKKIFVGARHYIQSFENPFHLLNLRLPSLEKVNCSETL